MPYGMLLRRGFTSCGVTTDLMRLDVLTQDERWMRAALVQAMRAHGTTRPNPTVGCVIVADGQCIGAGATEPWGGRHAERVAIDAVHDPSRLVGATLYTTLEPCAHYGRQPPCCELVASSTVSRVVVGIRDPNPMVAGKGLSHLLKAQKTLVSGILAAEVAAWHLPFTHRFLHGRPLESALHGYLTQTEHPIVKKYDLVVWHVQSLAHLAYEPSAPQHGVPPAHALVGTGDEIFNAPTAVWERIAPHLAQRNGVLSVFITQSPKPSAIVSSRKTWCREHNVAVLRLDGKPFTWVDSARHVVKVCMENHPLANYLLVPGSADGRAFVEADLVHAVSDGHAPVGTHVPLATGLCAGVRTREYLRRDLAPFMEGPTHQRSAASRPYRQSAALAGPL